MILIGQEWKPRWGYKRVNDTKDDWLTEIPDKAGYSLHCVLTYQATSVFALWVVVDGIN